MPFHQELINQVNQITILSNSLAIWGLGQLGVILKGADTVVYIDPYLSDHIEEVAGEKGKRVFPTPLHPQEVTNATYYLITHEHIDHWDVKTAVPAAQASPQAQFITTGWCVEEMTQAGIAPDRILTPKALEPVQLGDMRLTVIPAAHYEKEDDPQKGYRWLGFLLEWNGVTFYHSGDTIIHDGYVETLRSLPKIDVAMLPINGRDWYRDHNDFLGNFHPAEAVQLAKELDWDVLIPGHNDLIAANSIPPQHLVEAIARYNPRQKFKYLQPGELYYYVK